MKPAVHPHPTTAPSPQEGFCATPNGDRAQAELRASQSRRSPPAGSDPRGSWSPSPAFAQIYPGGPTRWQPPTAVLEVGPGRGAAAAAVRSRCGAGAARTPPPAAPAEPPGRRGERGRGGGSGVGCLAGISPFSSPGCRPEPGGFSPSASPRGPRADKGRWRRCGRAPVLPVTDAELRACHRGPVCVDGAGGTRLWVGGLGERLVSRLSRIWEWAGGGRKQPPSCRWSALRRAGPTPGFDPGEAAGADPAWSLGGLPEHRGFPWAGRCWIRCRAAARSAVPGVRWFVF